MTRQVFGIVIVLLGFALLQSCTIQKRKYLPGWYVTTKKLNRQSEANKTQTKPNEDVKSHEKKASAQEMAPIPSAAVEQTTNESTQAFNAVLEPLIDTNNHEPVREKVHREERIKSSQLAYFHQTKEVLRTVSKGDEEEAEDEKVSFSQFLGGFLGVLLALIALPPLFLLLFFLFEEDAEDLDGFSISRANSPFVQSFKKLFNDVFINGYLLLTILFFIFMGILLCVVLYNALGVLGILLGIVAFILLALLMDYLGRGLSKVLFPERD